MMGNSNSVVTKYNFEDEPLINNNNNNKLKHQTDQTKPTSDYEKIVMKELFDSQNEIINQLKDEVKKLKELNTKLEQRVKKLEEKFSLNSNGLVVQSFDNFSTRVANLNTNSLENTVNSNSNENKSEIFKLKQAQEDAKHQQNERTESNSPNKIFTIGLNDNSKTDFSSPNNKHQMQINSKKRDSNTKINPFLSEPNKDLLKTNRLIQAVSLSQNETQRNAKFSKRVSINLDQVDIPSIIIDNSSSGSSNRLVDKRHSLAVHRSIQQPPPNQTNSIDELESSSYYGIRDEKLVKIVHK